MQINKERQRKIRNTLHRSLPQKNTPEFALWTRNQQLSPLLRLPPELRNQIFELVLAVGQINVCFKKWRRRLQIKNGHRYYETTEGGFYCRILGEAQDPWVGLKDDTTEPSACRGMTLLSPVCRQLYHETVLLPFRLNAWSFQSMHVLDRFAIKEKRLPRSQRRAIRLLYVQTPLPKSATKYFVGLKVIVLEPAP
ncbi:hypothetical protein F5144DRAFT_489770 [Chaetomium tenue]|uniref:Uncharacterized protein n=1 Tax=Chaetomium tenue TaxID=1854479 RepID=A0ACB7P7B7_9PEZI|nr:hypothetical protein F5144DRAFT_489770 [Chaetomium globosum]